MRLTIEQAAAVAAFILAHCADIELELSFDAHGNVRCCAGQEVAEFNWAGENV